MEGVAIVVGVVDTIGGGAVAVVVLKIGGPIVWPMGVPMGVPMGAPDKLCMAADKFCT